MRMSSIDHRVRMAAIRRAVATGEIHSQKELRRRLQEEGLSVAQATLSRDLKTMHISKVADADAGYHYALQETLADSRDETYIQDLLRGWLSIEFSGNIGVVKTLAGHADSVAIAIDKTELKSVLGTIAGDDTLLIIIKEKVSPDQFMNELAELVPRIYMERQ